jgi:phospholipid/cholesterol/gamma-HCH transport system permease protein
LSSRFRLPSSMLLSPSPHLGPGLTFAPVYDHANARVSGWLTALGRVGRFAHETVLALRDVQTWNAGVLTQMRRVGVQSLPIGLFIAAFTGVVLALQSSYTFTGAVPLYFVGTLVGKTVMLELAPVLTGLALAGRVGANIAAELGTMRVTEQVDALETLAYNPFSYLVVPRVLAATLMFPLVVGLAMAVGVLSGWLTSINLLDLSSAEFKKGLQLFYQFKDVWFGLVKSMSFGFIVAMIGCVKGLSVRGGAEGVGRAATESVVLGAELILVLDAFWALTLL